MFRTKLALALVRSASAPLVLAALSGPAVAQATRGIQTGPTAPTHGPRTYSFGGPNTIDFDDADSPCAFMETVPLSSEYAALGVTFEGPAALDGGARLDECGNFGVTGHSAPNFLAFNVDSGYPTGGVPRGPETIRFQLPVDQVTIRVGSFGAGLVTMETFDGDGNFLDSLSVLGTDQLQPLTVTAAGIARARISFTGRFLVVDDLAWVASPCVTLDLSTEDDLSTPLANGQHVDVEFGLLAVLSSSGPNAGLAVFDSTPGGPNDPSQDRDLLVGTGNLLILQTENFPPDANDVFPRPNDDEDGGTISFDFTTSVELRSIRLVDLDAGDGTTSVVLTDAVGRTRTYQVPANWTGDLLLGQPGSEVLDLGTLDPQPGFGSIATASESAGFAPDAVVRLDVHLDGSGGIDDLELCTSSFVRASATPRNGAGVNPLALESAAPVLGRPWTAALDCGLAGFGGASGGVAMLEIRTHSASGRLTPSGEVLTRGMLLHRATRAISVAPSAFTIAVPRDIALAGTRVHAQGSCRGPASTGGKIREVRLVFTNAIDLVVGF